MSVIRDVVVETGSDKTKTGVLVSPAASQNASPGFKRLSLSSSQRQKKNGDFKVTVVVNVSIKSCLSPWQLKLTPTIA